MSPASGTFLDVNRILQQSRIQEDCHEKDWGENGKSVVAYCFVIRRWRGKLHPASCSSYSRPSSNTVTGWHIIQWLFLSGSPYWVSTTRWHVFPVPHIHSLSLAPTCFSWTGTCYPEPTLGFAKPNVAVVSEACSSLSSSPHPLSIFPALIFCLPLELGVIRAYLLTM